MYLTIEEYKKLTTTNNYCEVEAKELRQNIEFAEIRIDELTFNRIRHIGFENLTEFQQNNIKRAVCLQADHIIENGFEDTPVQSYSVLDISVTVAQGSASQAEKLNMSPVALLLLKQTGLMCRRL